MDEQADASASHDPAEALDETVLGHDGPGTAVDMPPDEPFGVEDPAIIQGGSGTPDDLLTREWRHLGEETDDAGLRIVPLDDDIPYADTEDRAVAADAVAVRDATPEERALRIVERP